MRFHFLVLRWLLQGSGISRIEGADTPGYGKKIKIKLIDDNFYNLQKIFNVKSVTVDSYDTIIRRIDATVIVPNVLFYSAKFLSQRVDTKKFELETGRS